MKQALAAAGTLVAITIAYAQPALAQGDAAEIAPPAVFSPAPVVETTTPHVGPNGAVIATGAILFGAAYLPMVAIGAGSPLEADRKLYIPVAGPWIDLAQRHVCEAGNLDCDGEIANKMLLAASGIFQGIGVLTVLAGFLVTEHDPVVTTAKAEGPSLSIAPSLEPGEAGVTAVGTF